LLHSSQKESIDFIIDFTNRVVENFATSKFAKYEIEEIKVFIDNNNSITQYICNRLWCTYRGSQTSPPLLESIHMALEKYLLELAENVNLKNFEHLLFYLLKNSKSASISSIIVSIILAYPEKLFNIAKILFRTKEFFIFDTNRFMLDQTHPKMISSIKSQFGTIDKNIIYENERNDADNAKHRNQSLEHLFTNYQFFRSEKTSKKEFERRQKSLWHIIDDYYEELPKEKDETPADKTWRLYLARMDRRKMSPTFEEKDGQVIINSNPQIDPKLKKYSENTIKKNSKVVKYTALKLWAEYKIKNDDKFKQYEKYEKNPKLAFEESQKIYSKLKKIKQPDLYQSTQSENDAYYLINRSIPSIVCSVLIRYYYDDLPDEQIKKCMKILLEVASSSFSPNYQYTILDGVESAISVLPILIDKLPNEKNNIKIILLLILFDSHSLGMAGEYSDYAINAILKNLWANSFRDAQSILFGYIYLKPKYNEIKKIIRNENYKKKIFQVTTYEIITKLKVEFKNDILKIRNNKITFEEIRNLDQLNLYDLKTVFRLIPIDTQNIEHKNIIKKIVEIFATKILKNDFDRRNNFAAEYDFFEQLSYYILSVQTDEIKEYLNPFVIYFKNSESIAELFKKIIIAQDSLCQYEKFWEIWNLFKDKVINLCQSDFLHWESEKILRSFLFASNQWNESSINWHTFKIENKEFFKSMAKETGKHAITLHALSMLLNNIGSLYLYDGISWISNMFKENQQLLTSKFDTNTVYYLENITKKYIYKYRDKIKKENQLKEQLILILDILIDKGSVIGYMLRESII